MSVNRGVSVISYLWIAKRRAKAATVFSPPDSCSISLNRFIGGIA